MVRVAGCEYELLKELDNNLEPDLFVKDKELLQLGDIEIEVLHSR